MTTRTNRILRTALTEKFAATTTTTATTAAVVGTVLLAALASAFIAGGAAAEDARGQILFDLCKQCHGEDGGGMEFSLAPRIAGLDQWYVESQLKVFKSGFRGLHAQDVGGLRMYPMSQWLGSDADITAVSSHVAGLSRVKPAATLEGGDAKKGEVTYVLCATCHGLAGEGNQVMNAPRLAGGSDWYMLTTLRKLKDGVRGTNAKNPNEMLMRGMALSLADEQAIKDVIAHIMTFD